jgi:sentrin-specific protease 8
MDPISSFAISYYDEEDLVYNLTELELHTKDWILLPINNNTDADTPAGGSHWSLLVYSRATNTFSHYDSSLGSGNFVLASEIGRKLIDGNLLKVPLNPSVIEIVTAPQQINGSDCGVYLLVISEYLIIHSDSCDRIPRISPTDIREKRVEYASYVS